MSLPNTGNFLVSYQLRLGIPAPPRFPDGACLAFEPTGKQHALKALVPLVPRFWAEISEHIALMSIYLLPIFSIHF